MKKLVFLIFYLIANPLEALNWTCTPWRYSDSSTGSGDSFVLIQNGKDYDMPMGGSKNRLKFVGEYLTTFEWQKMYRDEWGGIGAIFLRGEPNFKDGKADLIAAYPNNRGFVRSTCTKF